MPGASSPQEDRGGLLAAGDTPVRPLPGLLPCRGRSRERGRSLPGPGVASAAPGVPPGGSSPAAPAAIGARAPAPPGSASQGWQGERGSSGVRGVLGVPKSPGMRNEEDASSCTRKENI